MVWIANDDVVKKVYLEKLSRSNEITDDFDVGLGRCRFTARMIVCDPGPMGMATTLARHPSLKRVCEIASGI